MTQRATKQLGRYEILGAIHRGGMGEILLVRVRGSQGFSRKLVLKGILPELMDDAVSAHLFRREARLMASLEHPNIVQVFDVPEIDEIPYLAMEYVRGRNVHQFIQQCSQMNIKIPLRVAGHIVAELLRGLHYAHRASDESGKHLGIVHRDISPGNILISYFGEVKVTDFGIAKVADTPKITGPRSIRGKARYTAPETIKSGDCSPLSDVYAAGVVLSEILIGHPLFGGQNLSQTLLQIVSEPRSDLIARILHDAPEAEKIQRILSKALALSPGQRFRSAIEFADALDEVCQQNGGPVTVSELGRFIRQIFPEAEDAIVETKVSAKTPCGWLGKKSGKGKARRATSPLAEPVKSPSAFKPLPPPPPPPEVEDTEDLPPESYPPRAITCEAVAESEAIRSPIFASYLMENVGTTTDEEVAQKIDMTQMPISTNYSLGRIEANIWQQPTWLLVAVGVGIGAITAFLGSCLGMFTAGY